MLKPTGPSLLCLKAAVTTPWAVIPCWCAAFSLPVWCTRQWTPQSRPPRWQLAGTAGTWRCCRRRSFPTWRPWRCWWSCRQSGWCPTPPSPHLCRQFPDRKKKRGDDQIRVYDFRRMIHFNGSQTKMAHFQDFLIVSLMWLLLSRPQEIAAVLSSIILCTCRAVWHVQRRGEGNTSCSAPQWKQSKFTAEKWIEGCFLSSFMEETTRPVISVLKDNASKV